MGQLLSLDDLKSDKGMWYVNDYHYDYYNRKHNFPWPNTAFPYRIAIHTREFVKNRNLGVQIRTFIQRSLDETVIHEPVNRNYRYYYGKDQEWDHSYEVDNKWVVFSFESKESAFLFNTTFVDIIRPLTDWHPDQPEHEQMLKKLYPEKYNAQTSDYPKDF